MSEDQSKKDPVEKDRSKLIVTFESFKIRDWIGVVITFATIIAAAVTVYYSITQRLGLVEAQLQEYMKTDTPSLLSTTNKLDERISVIESKLDRPGSLSKVGFFPNCEVGLMNEDFIKNNPTRLSKSGLPYKLEYKIGEVNTASPLWRDFNDGPIGAGHFMEIQNVTTQHSTWVFIMGVFSDIDNPQRLLIVSRKTMDAMRVNQNSGLIIANVALLTEEDVQKDAEMIELRDNYY